MYTENVLKFIEIKKGCKSYFVVKIAYICLYD